jgi:hypothetical protein
MSYRAQVSSTPQQLAYGSQKENLTLTNVGSNTVYLANDSSVTPGSDLTLDVGGSILVEPGVIIWGVCNSGYKSQIAVTSQVGERFAYGTSSTRPISSAAIAAAVNNRITGQVVYDSTLASQFGSIQIVLQKAGTVSITANTYVISYTDYTAPIPAGALSYAYGANQVSGNTQTVQVTIAQTTTSSNVPAVSVTFPTRGYGGTWSITPITSAITAGELILDIVGQAATVLRPIVWTNPECIGGDASGTWAQQGNLYSRSSTTTYSGGGGSTSFYDFLLPPMNGSTILSVQYSVAGAGSPVGTWQLYANTATLPGFVLTYSKVAITDVLFTSPSTGSYAFYKTYDYLPRNPLYLRFGLSGTASMQSFTMNIGGNDS